LGRILYSGLSNYMNQPNLLTIIDVKRRTLLAEVEIPVTHHLAATSFHIVETTDGQIEAYWEERDSSDDKVELRGYTVPNTKGR
jgi:hypothetical protein